MAPLSRCLVCGSVGRARVWAGGLHSPRPSPGRGSGRSGCPRRRAEPQGPRGVDTLFFTIGGLWRARGGRVRCAGRQGAVGTRVNKSFLPACSVVLCARPGPWGGERGPGATPWLQRRGWQAFPPPHLGTPRVLRACDVRPPTRVMSWVQTGAPTSTATSWASYHACPRRAARVRTPHTPGAQSSGLGGNGRGSRGGVEVPLSQLRSPPVRPGRAGRGSTSVTCRGRGPHVGPPAASREG